MANLQPPLVWHTSVCKWYGKPWVPFGMTYISSYLVWQTLSLICMTYKNQFLFGMANLEPHLVGYQTVPIWYGKPWAPFGRISISSYLVWQCSIFMTYQRVSNKARSGIIMEFMEHVAMKYIYILLRKLFKAKTKK